jgi:hypothetical protein
MPHYINFQNNQTYFLFRFLIDSWGVDYEKLVTNALSEAEAEAKAVAEDDEAVAVSEQESNRRITVAARDILSRKLERYVQNEWFNEAFPWLEHDDEFDMFTGATGTQVLFVPILVDAVADIKYPVVAEALIQHVESSPQAATLAGIPFEQKNTPQHGEVSHD